MRRGNIWQQDALWDRAYDAAPACALTLRADPERAGHEPIISPDSRHETGLTFFSAVKFFTMLLRARKFFGTKARASAYRFRKRRREKMEDRATTRITGLSLFGIYMACMVLSALAM